MRTTMAGLLRAALLAVVLTRFPLESQGNMYRPHPLNVRRDGHRRLVPGAGCMTRVRALQSHSRASPACPNARPVEGKLDKQYAVPTSVPSSSHAASRGYAVAAPLQ